jgi:hypothetical protein
MFDPDAALKDYYRNRIQDMHREANRLAIEVGLEARDTDDVRTLAEAAGSSTPSRSSTALVAGS